MSSDLEILMSPFMLCDVAGCSLVYTDGSERNSAPIIGKSATILGYKFKLSLPQ
jgi:hypothetical protein